MSGERRMLVVPAGEEGRRLDVVVTALMPELSRSRVKQLLDEGLLTVGGAKARASRRMKPGEEVEVRLLPPEPPENGPRPQDLPLRFLYQDDQIVVVDKPAGMAVHPAAGSPSGTLVNALLHHVTDLEGIGGELRPGIVHRLDKDTTGVIVVAKNERALRDLQRQFKKREVKKVYLALVHGVPRRAEGILKSPLSRHPKDRKRFTGRGAPERAGARSAKTSYRVLEAFSGAASLEVVPETGRTHQIRVHLSEAGHPLLHDEVYGGARRDRASPHTSVREAAAALGHHALHAARLVFRHPLTKERMEAFAEPPPEWKRALDLLRGGKSS